MKNQDLGLLFVRLGLGICLFMHGFRKLTGGIGFIKSRVASAGMPEFFAYGVYITEVLAPLMLIIGFYSRVAAAIIAANALFIVYLAYPNFLALTGHGGFEAEILYLYMAMALCTIFCGSGKYAIKAD